MSTNDFGKVSGAAYSSDMEDWWNGSAEAPSPSRQNRPRHRTGQMRQPPPAPPRSTVRLGRRKAANRNRVLMYMTLGVLMACLFLQVNRYAQIASQTKQISRLVNDIKQLETDKTNLTLRLSARENINRIREEAMYNLGMDYPIEGQVRVLALGALSAESLSQMAAISADLAQ